MCSLLFMNVYIIFLMYFCIFLQFYIYILYLHFIVHVRTCTQPLSVTCNFNELVLTGHLKPDKELPIWLDPLTHDPDPAV